MSAPAYLEYLPPEVEALCEYAYLMCTTWFELVDGEVSIVNEPEIHWSADDDSDHGELARLMIGIYSELPVIKFALLAAEGKK